MSDPTLIDHAAIEDWIRRTEHLTAPCGLGPWAKKSWAEMVDDAAAKAEQTGIEVGRPTSIKSEIGP